MEDDKKYTVKEMADIFGKTEDTIRNWYAKNAENPCDGYRGFKQGNTIYFAKVDIQDAARKGKLAVSQDVQDAKDRQSIAEAQKAEALALRDAELFKKGFDNIDKWTKYVEDVEAEYVKKNEALKASELKLANDRIILDAQKLELENNTALIKDLENAIRVIMDTYDADIIARENDVIKLDRQLNDKNKDLDTLKQLTNEYYNDVINPIIEKVNEAIKQANKIATQAYFAAEKSKGKTADWYNDKANSYWKIVDKLKEYVSAIVR